MLDPLDLVDTVHMESEQAEKILRRYVLTTMLIVIAIALAFANR